MPGGVKCIQCGRSIKSDEHRHMVSMKWPVDVLEWVQRNATFGEAKVGAAMCCAHFDEPVHRNFSKHNPPKLIVSLDGTAWVSPSTRRSLALKRKKKENDDEDEYDVDLLPVQAKQTHLCLQLVDLHARATWFGFEDPNVLELLTGKLLPLMPVSESNNDRSTPLVLLDTFLNIFANGDTLARTGMMSGTVASTVAFRLERIMGALDPFVQEYVRLLLPREWLLHNKKAVGSEFGNNLLLVVDVAFFASLCAATWANVRFLGAYEPRCRGVGAINRASTSNQVRSARTAARNCACIPAANRATLGL